MAKITRIVSSAALALLLGSVASPAAAQQNSLPCPLEPQANRTIVLFNTTTPIVAHDTLTAALAGPITITLPAGIYNITASSYDAHTTRDPLQNQLREQYYLKLSNGQSTNRISDLPEDSDTLTEQIDTNFAVTSEVTSLTAQHAEYHDPGEPNSVVPVCIAFDNVTPTPTPSPNPSPSPSVEPSADQGSDDEPDCCPGPDPEPEALSTPKPKVAGIQTSVSSVDKETTEPTVAGDISIFPSAGFPFRPVVILVVVLLAAVMLVPATQKQPRN